MHFPADDENNNFSVDRMDHWEK